MYTYGILPYIKYYVDGRRPPKHVAVSK